MDLRFFASHEGRFAWAPARLGAIFSRMAKKKTTLELLDVDECSQLLGFPKTKVICWARNGEIPAISVFGKILFCAEDLENWLQAHRILAPKSAEMVKN